MAGPVLSANNHPPTLESQCHHPHPPTFLNNNPAPSLPYPPPHQAQPHQFQQFHHQQQPTYSHHPPIPPPPQTSQSHAAYTHPQHPLHQPIQSHYHYPAPPQHSTPRPTLPGIASILAFAGQGALSGVFFFSSLTKVSPPRRADRTGCAQPNDTPIPPHLPAPLATSPPTSSPTCTGLAARRLITRAMESANDRRSVMVLQLLHLRPIGADEARA